MVASGASAGARKEELSSGSVEDEAVVERFLAMTSADATVFGKLEAEGGPARRMWEEREESIGR